MSRSGLPVGNLLLFCACVGLAWLVYMQLDGAAPGLPTGGAKPAPNPARADEPDARTDKRASFRATPLDSYGEILARPLFHRTRRPIADPDAGQKTAAAGPQALRLVGIVVEAGGPVAFLKVKDAPEIVRVTPGAAVEGWVVQSIEGDSVTLAGKGDVARLSTKDEAPTEARADRSTERQKPKFSIGKQIRPGHEEDDNKD